MNIERIEVGDTVTVEFYRGQTLFRAEVKYIPQAIGDSWILSVPSGSIPFGEDDEPEVVYVQTFEKMTLVRKAGETINLKQKEGE